MHLFQKFIVIQYFSLLQIFCLLSSLFGKHIALLEIDPRELARMCPQYRNEAEPLSIIAR